jgi:Bacterial SH3 domain
MMNHKNNLGLLAALILAGSTVISSNSWALSKGDAVGGIGRVGDTCFVADPTDSSLNVRDRPDGRVVGKIANNTEVIIKAIKKDRKGKTWAKIIRQGSESSSGYVILKYLQCV